MASWWGRKLVFPWITVWTSKKLLIAVRN